MTFIGIVGIFKTLVTVLLPEKVEGNYLGRVFGVMTMISTSMIPLGMLVFGPISNMIVIEGLFIGTGILMFVLAIFLIDVGKPKTSEISE